jgi:hypothetical protein
MNAVHQQRLPSSLQCSESMSQSGLRACNVATVKARRKGTARSGQRGWTRLRSGRTLAATFRSSARRKPARVLQQCIPGCLFSYRNQRPLGISTTTVNSARLQTGPAGDLNHLTPESSSSSTGLAAASATSRNGCARARRAATSLATRWRAPPGQLHGCKIPLWLAGLFPHRNSSDLYIKPAKNTNLRRFRSKTQRYFPKGALSVHHASRGSCSMSQGWWLALELEAFIKSMLSQ